MVVVARVGKASTVVAPWLAAVAVRAVGVGTLGALEVGWTAVGRKSDALTLALAAVAAGLAELELVVGNAGLELAHLGLDDVAEVTDRGGERAGLVVLRGLLVVVGAGVVGRERVEDGVGLGDGLHVQESHLAVLPLQGGDFDAVDGHGVVVDRENLVLGADHRLAVRGDMFLGGNS